MEYYKHLFGPNLPCWLKLNGNFWPQDLQLLEADRASLIKSFNQEEIKEVVMGLKENSAPGPNGFGATFFQEFWPMIKDDLEAMFRDMEEGKLDLKRLNYGVITLVTKLKEANTIKQCRPICLLNVDYKCRGILAKTKLDLSQWPRRLLAKTKLDLSKEGISWRGWWYCMKFYMS